jgi:hypothetical protein
MGKEIQPRKYDEIVRDTWAWIWGNQFTTTHTVEWQRKRRCFCAAWTQQSIKLERKKVSRQTQVSWDTIIPYMNATGTPPPPSPVMIMPMKNMKAELIDRAPLGSLSTLSPLAVSAKGRFKHTVWHSWGASVVGFWRALHTPTHTRNVEVLLYPTTHRMQRRNVEVTEKARKCDIAVVCLLYPTTHRMQKSM